MVQDLRFTGTTLHPNTSDVQDETIVNYADLSSGKSRDDAKIAIGNDNNGDATVWYNYAAASAMTILGNSNFDEAQHSVCPKNWRLPSQTAFENIFDYKNEFSPQSQGVYYFTSLLADAYSFYWTTSVPDTNDGAIRANFQNNGSRVFVNSYLRETGMAVRCVARD